jgi:hypothetical protein
LGHGFCSYSDKDEVKETTCPDKCENKIRSYMSPAGSTANRCDKDSGWACDYTVTAVQCCGDPDCAGLTCEAEGYGARVKKCDLAVGSPTKYTCVCDACSSNSDCVNQCCEKSPEINSDVNGDGKIEDCVFIGSVALSNKYLCASASTTGWHECNAKTALNILGNDGNSYICLNQESSYSWIKIPGIRELMIVLAVAFFVIVKIIALTRRKKK